MTSYELRPKIGDKHPVTETEVHMLAEEDESTSRPARESWSGIHDLRFPSDSFSSLCCLPDASSVVD